MSTPRLPDIRTQTAFIHGLVSAYLSRLSLYLAEQNESGRRTSSSELASLISAGRDLVRGVILLLAYSKLRHAGLLHAAEALRRANNGAGCTLQPNVLQSFGDAAPDSAASFSLDPNHDLSAQLARVLRDFEHAEALSDFIARLWAVWLAPEPESDKSLSSLQTNIRTSQPVCANRTDSPVNACVSGAFNSGIPPPLWPPPFEPDSRRPSG